MAEPRLVAIKDVVAPKETLSAGEERFQLWRNAIGLPLGPLLALIIFLLPSQSLSPKAHVLAAILLWVITWWICEPVPIPVTALLGAVLCVISGVAGAKAVSQPDDRTYEGPLC